MVLLQLHHHYQLNTWIKWIERRHLQEDTRNIWVLGFGATYTRGFTVYSQKTPFGAPKGVGVKYELCYAFEIAAIECNMMLG